MKRTVVIHYLPRNGADETTTTICLSYMMMFCGFSWVEFEFECNGTYIDCVVLYICMGE